MRRVDLTLSKYRTTIQYSRLTTVGTPTVVWNSLCWNTENGRINNRSSDSCFHSPLRLLALLVSLAYLFSMNRSWEPLDRSDVTRSSSRMWDTSTTELYRNFRCCCNPRLENVSCARKCNCLLRSWGWLARCIVGFQNRPFLV